MRAFDIMSKFQNKMRNQIKVVPYFFHPVDIALTLWKQNCGYFSIYEK